MEKLNKIILLIACCIFGLSASASNNYGDTKFEQNNYLAAIQEYQQTIDAHESDSTNKHVAYAKFKLGACYSQLNKPAEAVKYIKEAISAGYQKPDAFLFYGKNLQKLGEYQLAKAAFEEFERLKPTDRFARNLIASCDFAEEHSTKNPISPETRLNGISTADNEYGIGLYKTGLIFARNNALKHGEGSKMYYADANDGFATARLNDTMIKDANNLNVGSFAIDTINNILYYTKCINKGGKDVCYIYYAEYKKDKWRNKGLFNVGDRYTDAAHPALSADGKRLYFSSNCAGGYGGSDIWYIERKQNGKWNKSKLINAGAVVNTPGNEIFPYIVQNTMIFASDGQVGFGGYDLYSAQINGKSIAEIHNLYRPINSSKDDINLIVSEKADKAYLVSNRQIETQDDIYLFEGIFSSMIISGHVYNKTTLEPIENAQVILNGMGKSLTVTTSEDGYYYTFVEAGDFYKLIASSAGYISDIAMIKTEKTVIGSFPAEQDFYLSQAAMSISGRVYDLETNDPFINEDVLLYSGETVVQQTKTDITGRYLFTDLENGKEYQVKVNKPNFLSISSKPFVYNENESNNSNLDLASISQGAAHGGNGYGNANGGNGNGTHGYGGALSQGREIILNDIYYNFDSDKLLPESKAALHRIVLLLNSNPNLKLEFGSHTDSRGTAKYNIELSEKRAKSVVVYLIEAGINKDRLTWKGYGKTRPVIKRAVTEGEHRINRRTTFKIIANY